MNCGDHRLTVIPDVCLLVFPLFVTPGALSRNVIAADDPVGSLRIMGSWKLCPSSPKVQDRSVTKWDRVFGYSFLILLSCPSVKCYRSAAVCSRNAVLGSAEKLSGSETPELFSFRYLRTVIPNLDAFQGYANSSLLFSLREHPSCKKSQSNLIKKILKVFNIKLGAAYHEIDEFQGRAWSRRNHAEVQACTMRS